MSSPLFTFMATSAVLLAVGLYGLMVKRNMIRLIISLEILVSAANLNFITFSAFRSLGLVDPLAHTYTIIIISIEACVIGVALAFVINAYKHYKTLDVTKLKKLRW
ncbi:MAG: NADH-quinone oxidoreductase subunit NuoK [archaeon GB-1867-035]|nr:NADH-quinone oxidoreductase subunit NuoK [Candidatus Culexmicrobium profundum]